jgi:hypothetical protein
MAAHQHRTTSVFRASNAVSGVIAVVMLQGAGYFCSADDRGELQLIVDHDAADRWMCDRRSSTATRPR